MTDKPTPRCCHTTPSTPLLHKAPNPPLSHPLSHPLSPSLAFSHRGQLSQQVVHVSRCCRLAHDQHRDQPVPQHVPAALIRQTQRRQVAAQVINLGGCSCVESVTEGVSACEKKRQKSVRRVSRGCVRKQVGAEWIARHSALCSAAATVCPCKPPSLYPPLTFILLMSVAVSPSNMLLGWSASASEDDTPPPAAAASVVAPLSPPAAAADDASGAPAVPAACCCCCCSMSSTSSSASSQLARSASSSCCVVGWDGMRGRGSSTRRGATSGEGRSRHQKSHRRIRHPQ